MCAAASLAFDRSGGKWQSRPVALPDNGDIAINHADIDGTSVSFSYTDLPDAGLADLVGRRRQRRLRLSYPASARFDASPYVAEQYEARSKDGTMVPYFVVRPKDQAGRCRRCSTAMAASRVR